MLEGTIIKGIGGFYYVRTGDRLIECRAKGAFRKDKVTPLVGDRVKIRISDEDKTGYIEVICERKSVLLRPPVANVDQAIMVFALKNPDPNLWLLDRFLLLAEYQNLEVVICFNKIDLQKSEEFKTYNEIYKKVGYKVINTSTKTGEGIEDLRKIVKDKTSVISGPSGVGKSSLLNSIEPGFKLNTGEVSQKTKRGKHTTRAAELLELSVGGWVVDTPGFSSLDISFIPKDDVENYFTDIHRFSGECRFFGCKHFKEPDCSVKNALKEGKISQSRYDNYLKFMDELTGNRRY